MRSLPLRIIFAPLSPLHPQALKRGHHSGREKPAVNSRLSRSAGRRGGAATLRSVDVVARSPTDTTSWHRLPTAVLPLYCSTFQCFYDLLEAATSFSRLTAEQCTLSVASEAK